MIITTVGDIMPGGLLSDNPQKCVDEDVLDVLSKGDVRVGTLECAFGNEPTYDKAKVKERGNVIYAKDADIRRLKELHIDIVSLANNHFFDLGKDGAQHTIELLDKEGIFHCGAGRNLKEAGAPVVVDIEGKKVAFLGFCDTDYSHVFMCTYATEGSPGINPLRTDYVLSEIKKNAHKYDYVVVIVHWGTEHTYYPNITTVKMSDLMLKAGACLILGSHPHRIQPVINRKKGSVVYSMGNFLFPERLIAPPKVTYYPVEQMDYSSLPVTDEYPLVHSITLKTLPYLARVGMIVTTTIDHQKIKSNYTLSYLNKDNFLQLLEAEKSKSQRKIIDRLGLLIKIKLYNLYILIRKNIGRICRKLC